MELKDYIKQSITSISEAITEAQEELIEKGTFVNPKNLYPDSNKNYYLHESGGNIATNIDFEISVTVEEKNVGEKEGGVDILKVVSAKAGQTNSNSHETINKLKFSIPLMLPKVQADLEQVIEYSPILGS